MRVKSLLVLLACVFSMCSAHAGSKRLAVAFFDYSKTDLGKTSFKAMRVAKYNHDCWDRFVEIEGIETAYIENPPKSLDRNLLLQAIRGSASAASDFALALKAEHLNGAYAFVLDPTGTYATIYGLAYQSDGAITNSASIRKPDSGNFDFATFSKALCEASKSMD